MSNSVRWFKPLETSVTISLAYTVDQVKLSSLLDILALGNYSLYTFFDELKKQLLVTNLYVLDLEVLLPSNSFQHRIFWIHAFDYLSCIKGDQPLP